MNEAKVVISGDATSATASAEQAATAYQSAFALMKAKLAELGFSFQETFSGMSESASRGAAGVQVASERIAASTTLMRESAAHVKESWEGMGAAMSKLNGLFLGLTAALAGGEVFEHAIEESTKYTSEVEKLSRAFGITLPQADGFHAALHKLGIETDTMTALSVKMVRQMRTHEDAFNRLGIVTRDASGHFRNLQDITLDSLERLRDYQAGVDRTGAAQVLFGRGTGDLTNLLKLNREEVEEGAKTARELGLKTTEEGVIANREYKESVREVSEIWDAFQIQIGRAILPNLTRIANWFRDSGPQAIGQTTSTLHDLTKAFATAPAEFKLWEAGFTKLWYSFALTLEDMDRRINVFELRLQLVGTVISMAMSGNWSQIEEAWSRGTATIDEYSQRTADHIITKWGQVRQALVDAQAAFTLANEAGEKDMASKGGWNSKDAWKTQTHLFGSQDAAAVPLGGGRLDNIEQGRAPKEKKAKEQSRLTDWEAALGDQQRAYALQMQSQDSFQEWSAQSTADYWAKILQIDNLSTAERNGATDKWLTAEKQARKEVFDAQIADLQEKIVAAKNNGDEQIALAKEIVDKIKAKYGEQSAEFRQAKANEDRIAQQSAQAQVALAHEVASAQKAAALDALEQDIAAAQHRVDMGLSNSNRLLAEEREFEARRHQILVEGIQADIAAAQHDPFMNAAALRKLHDDMEAEDRRYQAARNALDRRAVLQRTQLERSAINETSSSWGQALAKLATLQAGFASTIRSLYQGLQQAIGDALASIIQQWLAQHLAALLFKRAAQTTEAVADVASNAAVAGSAAFASTAAIPIIGPGLAPAAAAAAYASTMAFAPLAGAEKGWDVPAGINPVTQLHQREMVLPQKFADVIRGMAEGRGGGGAGGNHLHLHGNIIHNPTQLEAWFKQNASAVGAGVRHYARNGGRMTP